MSAPLLSIEGLRVGFRATGGGGDIPESPEKGHASLPQLGWRSGGDVAKVAFWVGDAPTTRKTPAP